MRFGVAGKGGVGKTTISAVLARSLALRGHRVVAIDCDSDPNLAANVGLAGDQVSSMRPLLDQSGAVWSLPTTPARSRSSKPTGALAPMM